jgi:oligopeptide/dipeptide ABC transporter ATP-binding protein
MDWRIAPEASMSKEGLIVDDVSISFNYGQLEVISNLSLQIGSGEALGLVGESGSCKSLTARAVLGLLPRGASASGRITFEGTSLLDLPPREMQKLRGARIAMIFQDPMSSLNPVLRVGAAIAQVIQSHERVSSPEAHRQAVMLMDRVGIRDAKERSRAYPHQFSGGMRQRIMIAMALAANPTLLLADEPTTALDVVVQAGILKLLAELRREKKMGLLLVSHDLAVVGRVSDRVAVMYTGQIVEEGPTAEVLFRPHMPYTAGLIASVRRDRTVARLSSIPGAPPAPGGKLEGCRFAPRCPLAADACRTGPIPRVPVGQNHWARCIRTAEARMLKPSDFAFDRGRAEEQRNG